jgi:hypothetical protein
MATVGSEGEKTVDEMARLTFDSVNKEYLCEFRSHIAERAGVSFDTIIDKQGKDESLSCLADDFVELIGCLRLLRVLHRLTCKHGLVLCECGICTRINIEREYKGEDDEIE